MAVVARRRGGGRWISLCLLVFVVLFGAISEARADVFRPAYLELRQLDDTRYEVQWKVPARDGASLALEVVLPENCEANGAPRTVSTGDALLQHWETQCAGGLVGAEVRIDGRAVAATDIIVRVERLDGSEQVEHLGLDQPHFVVRPPAGAGEVAWSYTVLGFEHILGGIDHLLFVLGLLLLVSERRRVVATVTAFTIAHSITLAAATLDIVRLPSAPVEAVIALSIAAVAVEAVQNGDDPETNAPWTMAFVFGLLHGLGFAGALSEVGLPESAIPLALLTFNVGVELGQLAFIAVVLVVAAVVTRWIPRLGDAVHRVAPYVIGSVAMFWVFERVAAFFV